MVPVTKDSKYYLSIVGGLKTGILFQPVSVPKLSFHFLISRFRPSERSHLAFGQSSKPLLESLYHLLWSRDCLHHPDPTSLGVDFGHGLPAGLLACALPSSSVILHFFSLQFSPNILTKHFNWTLDAQKMQRWASHSKVSRILMVTARSLSRGKHSDGESTWRVWIKQSPSLQVWKTLAALQSGYRPTLSLPGTSRRFCHPVCKLRLVQSHDALMPAGCCLVWICGWTRPGLGSSS